MGDEPLALIIYTQFINETTASFVGYGNPYIMVTAVSYRIGAPLAFLTIPGAYYLLKERQRLGLFLALSAYFPLGVMMVLTLFASTASRYVFMSLPSWIILIAVAIRELYTRARQDKRVSLWILGVFLALFFDPVIEDVLYYLPIKTDLLVLIGVVTALYLLGVLAIWRWPTNSQQRPFLIWTFTLLFSILAYTAVANKMYYAYQGGHRDNWKEAAHFIQQEKETTDLVVSAIPAIVDYYLQDNVQYFGNVDLDTILQNGQRVWFIEDFGIDQTAGKTFEQWTASHCDLAGDWSQYVGGRMWKMRVHRCEPIPE
jgi:hypothetical protein